MAVERLLKDELEYELKYRGVTGITTVEEMRKSLRKLLKLEKEGVVMVAQGVVDIETELKTCSEKLKLINQQIEKFQGTRQSAEFRNTDIRLTHVLGRLERLSCSEETQRSERSKLLRDTLSCMTQLEGKINPPTDAEDSEAEEVFHDAPVTTASSSKTTEITAVKQKVIPVKNWGLTFDGLQDTLSVNAFLERVEELRIARNMTKVELWTSAIDLFEYPALSWFRSASRTVRNWDEFVKVFREEFQSPTYEDDLMDEIRN